MSRDPQLRLADIVESCTRIAAYIDGMDASAFALDLKTQDAVIPPGRRPLWAGGRQFEIIGEAVKSLPRELTSQDASIPWAQIAGFRDVLAHSYFAVDASVIWDAASEKAPALKISCERFLSP
jgi:uncharacterized protein with HEPN domain